MDENTTGHTYWAITGIGYGRGATEAEARENYLSAQQRNFPHLADKILEISWGRVYEVSAEITGFQLGSDVRWSAGEKNYVTPAHVAVVGDIGEVPDWAQVDQ